MILKGSALARQIQKSGADLWCVLVFGDDDGVVSDTAEQIGAAWGKTAAATNTITLDDDDIRRDPGVLFDRIETASLLGDTDIIRIRTSGEKIAKHVLDLVERADAEGAGFANKLIILNGSLNKRSRLRASIEASRTAAAVHVFADSEQSVRDLVDAHLKADNVSIEIDALDRFVSGLPGHRGLANQEAEKLALFGRDLGRPISTSDIKSLSLTDADSSARDMVQYALNGNHEACLAEYDRLSEAGTSAISILRILEMESRRLLQAASLPGGGANAGMKLKPPVWQSEWPAFRARMDRWSAPALTRLIAAIHDQELLAKQSGSGTDPAIRILLLNILKSAAGRSRQTASQ